MSVEPTREAWAGQRCAVLVRGAGLRGPTLQLR